MSDAHKRIPWLPEQSARLISVWRELLESQNGEGVDGGELPKGGGSFGQALDFVPAGSRVLILGAGQGHEVAYAERLGYAAVGLTLGSGNLRVAKERYPDASMYFRDAHASMFAEMFDAVIGFQVLEHSPAPIILLLECAHVLRPGGLIILETPSPLRHTGGRSLHHILCPTPRQLVGLCEKAGFCDIRQWSAGHPLADASIDRSDLPDDLLTIGWRATHDQLLSFDLATRRILSS